MKLIFLTLISSLFANATNQDLTGNQKALLKALDDEYKALATYQQVINDFGNSRPFSNIIQSEQRHIEALKPFFNKYQLSIPNNPYTGKVPSYSSLGEACAAGVEAELENVALYDEINSLVDDQDLKIVFERLQSASLNKHLKAFMRCSQRN